MYMDINIYCPQQWEEHFSEFYNFPSKRFLQIDIMTGYTIIYNL